MIRAAGHDTPYQATFTNGVRTAVADAPAAKGAAGRGSARTSCSKRRLATCLTMTAQMTAAAHGIPLTGVRSEVRLDRTVPGEPVLHYALEFDGPLSADQVARLRAAAADCPVGRTLTGRVTVRPAAPAPA
ncbi:MAG: OsmC family protein [Gemmataceae bacterium]